MEEELESEVKLPPELQKAILRHLPMDTKQRVVRKFPAFQEMADNSYYNVKELTIFSDLSFHWWLQIKEHDSHREWIWNFTDDYIERSQTLNKTIVKKEQIDMVGPISEKFKEFMDFILPKITTTLDYIHVAGTLPTVQWANQIKAKKLDFAPNKETVSISPALNFVDPAILESVFIRKLGSNGNYLNDPLLSTCNLELTLQTFNVEILSNVVSKSVVVHLSEPVLTAESLAELAVNLVRQRAVGFNFKIEETLNWDIYIEEISKKKEWNKKWFCKAPCALFEFGDVEISLRRGYCRSLIMVIMEKGTANELCANLSEAKNCWCEYCREMRSF